MSSSCNFDADHVTVLLGGDGYGLATRPLFIIPAVNVTKRGKRLASSIGALITGTPTRGGGMTPKVLFDYLQIIIKDYRHLAGYSEETPLFVILDGQRARYAGQFIAVMETLGVDITLGPAHGIHMWQMTDVASARRVKGKASLSPGFQRQKGKTYLLAYRVHWEDILEQRLGGLQRACERSTILNGWRATGMFPWDLKKLMRNQETPPLVAEVIEVVSAAWSTRNTFSDVKAAASAQMALTGANLSDEEFERNLRKRSLGGFVLTNNAQLQRYLQNTQVRTE